MQLIKAGEAKSLRLFGHFSILLLISISSLNAESFADFKKSQAESFQNFKDERDRAFNKYLKEEWKAYQVQQGVAIYEKPKPKQITPAKPSKIKSVGPKTVIKVKKIRHIEPTPPQKVVILEEKKEIIAKETPTKVAVEISEKVVIVEKKDLEVVEQKVVLKDVNFEFYGTKLGFDISDSIKHASFSPKSQKGITKFFETVASSEYENLIEEIKNVSTKMNLNDWGVYLLTLKVSDSVFENPDDSKLLSWFIFNKLGFAVKVGIANKHVVLMHYSKKDIYSTPNYSFGKKKYYVVANYAKGRVGKLYSYKQDYPDATKALDLSMKTLPSLSSQMKTKTLSFNHLGKNYKLKYQYNQNLINFMGTYPQADYETFFNTPVDSRSYKAIASSMKKYVDGMQASDAMNFVLNFVQNAFKYERDDQQFGREKVMFAQETLYFEKSDCEDRAVLYSYLVKELFGISVVGVKYKDHMATALYIPMEGDSVKNGNKKYVIADPTYINANIGQSMPKYKSIKPDSFVSIRTN